MRIPSLSDIKGLFTGNRIQQTGQERSYRELSAIGGTNADWGVSQFSADSELWQNAYLLTARCRDLFRCNTTVIKYRDLIAANTFGSNGIMLRMLIQETENRVVYSPDQADPAKKERMRDELFFLAAREERVNRVLRHAEKLDGRSRENYRAMKLAEHINSRSLEDIQRGQAIVQVGQSDLYANSLFQLGWADWQRAEYADTQTSRHYNVIRQLRLWGAITDGDFFMRMVNVKSVNKYGFSLQLINAEWCDRFLNTILPNGNVIRMGIEYKFTPWGIGAPVAYYFIQRHPMDWQFSIPAAFSSAPGPIHLRIDASEIIHYRRCVDAEGTRPAPWLASIIPKARQLDQYELAEVTAAREQACKTGFYYSDIMPEGGALQAPPDPTTGISRQRLGPGDREALKFGIKYQQNDPTHPNGNFETFRKGMLRSLSAGLSGADYNTLANDLENINFSAGRLGRLDTNEMSMMIQQNDIDVAETPIFERWQESALIFGAIPLPLAKLPKYNRKKFQGRRWQQVDEVKAVTAAALRVANHFSSDQKECADQGLDFMEMLLEQAEANMAKEELGIPVAKTVSSGEPKVDEDEDSEDGQTAPAGGEDSKPAAKKSNGKKTKLANGARFAIADV